MNEQSLKDLFYKIVMEVLGLYPESDSNENGIVIFSSSESDFSFLVFIGEKGVDSFCKAHPLGRKLKTNLQGRLFMIDSGSFFLSKDISDLISKQEAAHPFSFLGVFNSGEWKIFQEHAEYVFSDFIDDADRVRPGILQEADFVGHFLHELRHLFQLRMLMLGHETLPATKEQPPVLTNMIIPHDVLRKYWKQNVDEQMSCYEDVYPEGDQKKKLILLEKDAMAIQLYAFDYWLTNNCSFEDKLLKLRDIVKLC